MADATSVRGNNLPGFVMKKLIPDLLKPGLRYLRKTIRYWGRGRYCPVCARHASHFEPFGIVPRDDACCVWCGALERHRLVWLFLQRRTDFFSGTTPRKMLHVAPERCFAQRFRRVIGGGYLTADLLAEDVDVRMDICDMHLPDNSFDIIYCSHVLEHVADDRRAMREFHRVLADTGWAVILVPISAAVTFEDPSITDRGERLRVFGQEDHVRRYGPDYIDRLLEAGFVVSRVFPSDFLSREEIERMAITDAAGEIFHCRKASRSTDPIASA